MQTKMDVCIHEAGHAVAAIKLHNPIKHASIIRDGDTAGHVLNRDDFEPKSHWSRGASRPANTVRRHLAVLYAGMVAERHLTRRSWAAIKRGGQSDHDTAVDIFLSLNMSDENVNLWSERAWDDASQVVIANLGAIVAVANELYRAETIGRNTLHRIIREADNGN